MSRGTKKRSQKKIAAAGSPLMVRLDSKSKQLLVEAAKLRHVSVSDFVRLVTVPQARREVEAAQEQTIRMTPEEQLAFWKALHEPVKLTPAQLELRKVIRGEA